jgi:bacteriocin-like protein
MEQQPQSTEQQSQSVKKKQLTLEELAQVTGGYEALNAGIDIGGGFKSQRVDVTGEYKT